MIVDGACENGDISVIEKLFNDNEMNEYIWVHGLARACESNQLEIIKFLIQKGSELNFSFQLLDTRLTDVCENDSISQGDRIKIASLLIYKGINIDYGEFDFKYLITRANKLNNHKIAEYLSPFFNQLKLKIC